MAANDYYQNHPTYENQRPPPVSKYNTSYSPSTPSIPDTARPTPIQTNSSDASPYKPYQPYTYNSDYQSSHQTIESPIASSGRLHDAEQYADTIPLRQHGKKPAVQDDYSAAYPGPQSPESQRPLKESNRYSQPAHRAGGWFSGKIPWFVYFVSLVQIAVFIGEIVKNCRFNGLVKFREI